MKKLITPIIAIITSLSITYLLVNAENSLADKFTIFSGLYIPLQAITLMAVYFYKQKKRTIKAFIRESLKILFVGFFMYYVLNSAFCSLFNTKICVMPIYNKWIAIILSILTLLYGLFKTYHAEKIRFLIFNMNTNMEYLHGLNEYKKILCDLDPDINSVRVLIHKILKSMTDIAENCAIHFKWMKNGVMNETFCISAWVLIPDTDKKHYNIVDYYANEPLVKIQYEKVAKKHKPKFHNKEQCDGICKKFQEKKLTFKEMQTCIPKFTSATGYIAQDGKSFFNVENIDRECYSFDCSYQRYIADKKIWHKSFVAIPLKLYNNQSQYNGVLFVFSNVRSLFPRNMYLFLQPLAFSLQQILQISISKDIDLNCKE